MKNDCKLFQGFTESLMIFFNQHWVDIISCIKFSDSFFVAIIGFQTAVIAFLIPLSIEIISKISERYSSDVIVRQFENYSGYRYLPKLLLLNIIIAAILLLFEKNDSLIYKFLSLVVLFLFLYSCGITLIIIKRVKKYVSNIGEVINELASQAQDVIK